MDMTRKDLDRIVVDIRCTSCPENARCGKCQSIVDAAVATTLAEGTDPKHIHVRQY